MPVWKKLLLSVSVIIAAEVIVYVWAAWTASLKPDNFFAIEPAFIFDKCARNSGRISAAINLLLVLMAGHYGFKKIYREQRKKELFSILITLFAVIHSAHFFFVFQNFRHHTLELSVQENFHGFLTFLGVFAAPVIVWLSAKLNFVIYVCMLFHVLNVSYFIMETFYNKIKADNPAYHNQFGIYVTAAACLYVLYRVHREWRDKPLSSVPVEHPQIVQDAGT